MALDLSKFGMTTQPAQNTSSGLDVSKFGMQTLAPSATATAPARQPILGNPVQDVQAAGSQVNQAITGKGEYAGKSPLERGFAASSAAALAIPTVATDVIPGGKAVLGAVGDAFKGATDFAGAIPSKLADVAQKIGIMSPEQRAEYDKNNADFANSPTGIAIQSAAKIANYAGDIANVILGADSMAKSTQDLLDNKIPQIKQQMQERAAQKQTETLSAEHAKQQQLVQATADELGAVEGRYAKGRNANAYSKDEGYGSRQRIAQSGVLKYSVDENGMIRTKQQGGAVDTYKAMTVDPKEGVVRAALEREGSKVNISEVQSVLEQKIRNSGLEGASLVRALNGVKDEIAGLRLKADQLGYVPTTLLHDAKINQTSNINYFTAPEVSKAAKALANGYKTLVEDNSSFNIKPVNAELANYYEDIARIERLDGMRVEGGRLGKYSAQIAGNIVGGAFGSIGGPIGAAIGTVLGGEAAALIKGKTMGKTFTNASKPVAPQSPVLDKAVKDSKAPRLMLPQNTSGFRSVKPSGKTIVLPKKSGL